jgi:hypothetical protein
VRKALCVAAAGAALWLAPGALASGWCGTGESATDRPDITTGAQVHAIVVTPSDSADQFAADANRLADDVASMSAWWTTQDATRVPRYDLASFPNGNCLDISFLRLPLPASSYVGTASFRTVEDAIAAGGFFNPYKDYVVYYDGPAVAADICGTGGGTFGRGGGFAIVWLNGCPDVPSDSIETHELLHALGAGFAQAPNDCPPPNNFHPCDSTLDVLYPYATPGETLAQQVLDFNHDDYYAHSGSWPDIQDAIFLHHLDAPLEALGVTLAGRGTVTSDLPGVNCLTSCTTQWDQGTAVVLTATPATGARFVHWTGSCSGSSDCVVGLSQAVTVTAMFGPATVSLAISTRGKGAVSCSPSCSKTVAAGSHVTLRARPAKGWAFARWGGACTGTRLACTPTTDRGLAVRAYFKKKR